MAKPEEVLVEVDTGTGEILNTGTGDITVVPHDGFITPTPEIVGLYPNDPLAMVALASAQANELSKIIDDRNLFTMIRRKKHVSVEGWTLLGSMLGVFPVVEWTHELFDKDGDNDGWEARVEARNIQGQVVGAAEAECRRTESTWKSRESFSLRSMAQTRATSKALRLPLGFIMSLAGYEATPTEEFSTTHIVQAKTEVLALLNGDKTTAKELWDAALEDLDLASDEEVKPEHIEPILTVINEKIYLKEGEE